MWTASISSNMNFPAPIAAAAFLAGCGGLFLAIMGALIAVFVKRTRWVLLIGGVVGLGVLVYFGLLLAFALASHEKVLARGEEKYFCEIDCHLAYSVQAVNISPSGADLSHYVITLKTRFDVATISPHRPKDIPLKPNPRIILLADSQGHLYMPNDSTGTDLTTPLRPGESYTTDIDFLVSKQATELHMLVESSGWTERLLIGDESSPMHKKTWFGL